MEISDFIALLAFFLSLYSAIVSTALALNENLKLKLEYLNVNFLTLSLDNKIVNKQGEYLGGYTKNAYTIAIKIRIINKSKSPTTINEFVLNDSYTMDSSFNVRNSLVPTSFEDYGTMLTAHETRSLERQLIKPLIELPPLSSTEGYIIFTQLNEVPEDFYLQINAVQKSKKFHLKFDIVNNYTNEIV